MPLDTRIALSGNNPLDTQAKLMTLAELSDQQQARGLQMQQTRDNMQRQQQLRGLLGGLAPDTTDDGRVGALRNAGYFDEADKLQTGVLARDKTRAETDRISQETWDKRRETAIRDVAGFQSPEEARQSLIDSVRNKLVDPAIGEQLHRSIPQDPNAFRQWQVGMLRRIMAAKDAAETLTPKLRMTNLGGQEVMVDENPTTTATGAGSTFARTATPGEVLTDNRARSEGAANRAQAAANFNATQAAGRLQYDAERGGVVNLSTGQFTPAMQGGQPVGPKDKGLNDAQSKANLFGSRMQQSDAILARLAATGTTSGSRIKEAAEGVPLVGGALGAAANATVASEPQQQVEQAQRDFINAVLRRESGAAIADSEFANAKKQYFPAVGDSRAVIQQKAMNRKLAIEGVLAEVPAGKRTSSGGATGSWDTPAADSVPPDIAAILKKHGAK